MMSHAGWLEAGGANAPTYTAPRRDAVLRRPLAAARRRVLRPASRSPVPAPSRGALHNPGHRRADHHRQHRWRALPPPASSPVVTRSFQRRHAFRDLHGKHVMMEENEPRIGGSVTTMVKNAVAKSWNILPSSDGKRWSAWPAGDKPSGGGACDASGQNAAYDSLYSARWPRTRPLPSGWRRTATTQPATARAATRT